MSDEVLSALIKSATAIVLHDSHPGRKNRAHSFLTKWWDRAEEFVDTPREVEF